MKHLDPNDPRFTAKALGEDEIQSINPETSQEFEAIQSFADNLKSELKAQDQKDTLTEEQKDRVRKAIEPKKNTISRFPMWINVIAACLVLGLVGVISFKILDKSKSAFLSEVSLSTNIDSPKPPPSPRESTDINYPIGNQIEVDTIVENQVEIFASRGTNAGEVKRTRNLNEQLGQSGDEVFELSPFVLVEDEDTGYGATSTLSGTRINVPLGKEDASEVVQQLMNNVDDSGYNTTALLADSKIKPEIKDLGASISVVTTEFLEDVGATESEELLSYTTVTSAGGIQANFSRSAPKPETIISEPYLEPTNFRQQQEPWNREAYDRIIENTFKNPIDNPLSTFSIDVDTASYANVRRYLNGNQLPPADAVRIEEMLNYFSYDYDGPKDETPFAVHVDSASAPWNEDHRLVRIALQGEKVDSSERLDANLVFLIDVSDSMSNQNKLPLVQRSMNLLVDQMEARDRIAVVVYAGASGLALPSTTANNKETIQHAISNLKSGGSTNGGAGIELAYSVAQKHFVKDGINRVILCTDGDFNVGTSDRGSLTRLIEGKAKTGVFFSVLGFGTGNYQDATMEELSNKGNGNYGYVDSFNEARKVFVDDMLDTLFTIAKDVKIQVEFNPTHVGSYRLIGYENRILAKEDFNDDKKDAGEIGAGHRVTALYEIVPKEVAQGMTVLVDPLKYQAAIQPVDASPEILTVKLRYKQPDEDVSQLIEQPFIDNLPRKNLTNDDFSFATAVASFGMLLRNSELVADMTLNDVLAIATKAKGNDSGGLRSEFIELVEKAIALTATQESLPASSESKE